MHLRLSQRHRSWKFQNSRKTKKPKNFENETFFFLQLKILIHYTLKVTFASKLFFAIKQRLMRN